MKHRANTGDANTGDGSLCSSETPIKTRKQSHNTENRPLCSSAQPHFFGIRFPLLISSFLFLKSLAHIAVTLFVPTLSSFSSLQGVRAEFPQHALIFLTFLLFIVFDYFIYRKSSFRIWRFFEWLGAIIIVLLSVTFFLVSYFSVLRNDLSVNTEQYRRWTMCLEENGFKVNRCVDNHSLIEPQSWEAMTYLGFDVDQPEVDVFFAECSLETFARNYGLQFVKDHKTDEIQQYKKGGITYIIAKRQNTEDSVTVTAILLHQKSVVLLSVKGEETKANELFNIFLPTLPDLFE